MIKSGGNAGTHFTAASSSRSLWKRSEAPMKNLAARAASATTPESSVWLASWEVVER